MARVATSRKAKKAVNGHRSKSTHKIVVIDRPTTVARTKKTFGVTAQRSRDIDAMVDEVMGSAS